MTLKKTQKNSFRLRMQVAALVVGIGASSVFGLCYKLGSRPGFGGPGVEDTPCTALLANGCSLYTQCPAGTSCQLDLWRGKKPCIPGTAVVPMLRFTAGTLIPGTTCCGAGVPLPPTGATCTVPTDALGTTTCLFIIA